MRSLYLALMALTACGRIGFRVPGDAASEGGLVGRQSDAAPPRPDARDGGRDADSMSMFDGRADADADVDVDANDGSPDANDADGSTAAREGEACSAERACDVALACSYFASETGVCERECALDSECDATFCAALGSTTANGACAPVCDPIAGSGCPEPLACRLFGIDTFEGSRRYGPGCGPDVGSPAGTPCDSLLDCAPGTVCLGTGTCSPVCVIGSTDCECLEFAPPLVVAGVAYGFCR